MAELWMASPPARVPDMPKFVLLNACSGAPLM